MSSKIPRKPARKTKRAPEKSRGLRIQIKGRLSSQELLPALQDAVRRLQDHGVTHVSGVNLYVTPLNEQGTAITPVARGREVYSITITPYRSAADEHGV